MFRLLLSAVVFSAIFILQGQVPSFDHFCPVTGSSGITKVSSMAIGNDGILYVADASQRRVLAFDQRGELIPEPALNSVSRYYDVLGTGSAGELLGYDESSGKITVLRENMLPFSFGEKGSKPGQLGQILGLAMDAEGYVYALNAARKQIDVFDPQGRYLTWISGGSEEIQSPVSLCISRLNELCLLDVKGPSVIMYNPDGVQVNMHRNFASWNTFNASDPVSMACLADGSCLIADNKKQSITLIGRYGHVNGSFGSAGTSAPGAFSEIQFITASPNGKFIGVWDLKAQNAQVFTTAAEVNTSTKAGRLLKSERAATSRPPLIDLAVLPNGNQAAIKAGNPNMVVIYKDTSSVEVSSLLSDFKGLREVVADQTGKVYALDENRDEVYVFDANGRQLRKIGQEIKDKLKNPVSIAIQSNNQLLVCDAGNGRILAWDESGLFQRVLNSSSNSVLEDPRKICIDSKDRIYILDAKTNCIYRTPANGWPMDIVFLKAKSERPGGEAGKIIDFFIDDQDQLFLFNESTNQLELYQWDIDPVFKCSVGHGGSGPFSLAGTEWLVFDPASYRIDLTAKAGLKNSIRVGLKPPPPTSTPIFSASGAKLILSFERLTSPLVDGYALIRTDLADDDGSFSARSSGGLLELDESTISGTDLFRYQFVSMGKAGISDASLEFPNYIGQAERLLADNRFDQAIGAFEKSLKTFGYAEGIKRYVASRYHEVSLELSANFEGDKAVRCLKGAYDLYPEDPELRNAAIQVFRQYFEELALRGELTELLSIADRYQVVSGLRASVFTAMDSTVLRLKSSSSVQLLEASILLGKKLCEWVPSEAVFARHLAEACLSAYELEQQLPGSFSNAENLLAEAEFYADKAVDIRVVNFQSPFEEELFLLSIWREAGKAGEIVERASRSIVQFHANLNAGFETAYKLHLAEASMETGQYALAIEQYRKLLTLHPDKVVFRQGLIDGLIANDDLGEARQLSQDALAKVPGEPHAHAALGRIALKEGNAEEAVFQLDKAVFGSAIRPAYAADLAKAYERAGNQSKAMETYDVAIDHLRQQLRRNKGRGIKGSELSQQKRGLLYDLARMAAGVRSYDLAMASFNELLAEDQDDPLLFLDAGNTFLQAGEVYQGASLIEKAYRLDSKSPEIQSAYQKALDQRKKFAQNKSVLEVMSVSFSEIHPSLYLNYANAQILPAGYVHLANHSPEPVSPSSVKLEVGHFGLGSGVATSPVIPAYTTIAVPLALVCDEDVLENTTTRVAEATVTVEYGNGKMAKRSGQIVLHPRNSIKWADKRRLAAFVSPADQHFIELNKSIDRELRSSLGLDLPDPLLKAVQAYTVLQSMQFTYSPDPVQGYAYASMTDDLLDFMQYPSETLARRAGDCDDLVALFAAMMECSGVPSAYIDVPGHVLFAFNSGLSIKELDAAGLSPQEVVNINGQAWIPLETTLIERNEFLSAWKSGAQRYYQELERGNFPVTVPLADARKSYSPSEFWPEGSAQSWQINPAVIPAYEDEVTALFAKLNERKIQHLEARFRSEPDNLFVKNRYALMLAKSGETEKAEVILRNAAEDSPGNPILLNNLGNVMQLAHKDDEAINFYVEANTADPSDAEILINLCKVYLRKGDKVAAKSSFQKALAIDTDIAYRYDYLQSELK